MLSLYTPNADAEFNGAPKNPYALQIDAAHAESPEKAAKLPGILYVFAALGAAALPLAQYTEQIMRGPSSLSELTKELIAVVVSATNRTEFCARTHAATAVVIAHGVATSARMPLDAKMRMVAEILGTVAVIVESNGDQISPHVSGTSLEHLLAFCALLTKYGDTITPDYLEKMYDALRSSGWSDLDISEAVRVTALFNMYNRLVGGHTVPAMDDASNAASGLLLARYGYLPLDAETSAKAAVWVQNNVGAISKDLGFAREAAQEYIKRPQCDDPACSLHGDHESDGARDGDGDEPDEEQLLADLRAAGIVKADETLEQAIARLENSPAASEDEDGDKGEISDDCAFCKADETGIGDDCECECDSSESGGCDLSVALSKIGKPAEGTSEAVEVVAASEAPACKLGESGGSEAACAAKSTGEGGCGGKALGVESEGGCGGHKSIGEGGCGGHKLGV